MGVMVDETTSFDSLVNILGDKFGHDLHGFIFRYSLEFDKMKLLDLFNDQGLKDLI